MIGHLNFFLEVEGNQLDSLEEYASVAHVTFPSARGKRKSHVALNAPSDNPLCPEPIPIHHDNMNRWSPAMMILMGRPPAATHFGCNSL